MIPESGSQLPFSRPTLSDAQLAAEIGKALKDELGASRRATKTVMRWTGVSDHTARSWINGRSTPGGRHLILLAAQSQPVMTTVLRLTGHPELELGFRLQTIEAGLESALHQVRALRTRAR